MSGRRSGPTAKKRKQKIVVSFDPKARAYVADVSKVFAMRALDGGCAVNIVHLPFTPELTLLVAESCSEYLTGFHKRKNERRKQALEQIAKRDRDTQIERRRLVRAQLSPITFDLLVCDKS